MAGKTKDEKFILAAYDAAIAAGDLHFRLNRYDIGKKVGINVKTVDTICKLLAQANFIKFEEEGEFYLTEQGKRLVDDLKQGMF